MLRDDATPDRARRLASAGVGVALVFLPAGLAFAGWGIYELTRDAPPPGPGGERESTTAIIAMVLGAALAGYAVYLLVRARRYRARR